MPSQPQTMPVERRVNPARREAFAQRDSGKRENIVPADKKIDCKLAASAPATRML